MRHFHGNNLQFEAVNRGLRASIVSQIAIYLDTVGRGLELGSLCFFSSTDMSTEGQFFLSATGSIEHAEFYDVNNAYCKYSFHFGPDWSVVAVRPTPDIIKENRKEQQNYVVIATKESTALLDCDIRRNFIES